MRSSADESATADGPIVIRNAYVVTMDAARTEHRRGYVVVDGSRITEVGAGEPAGYDRATVVDGSGCVVTPGLINTHHHLYQWITRGLAVDHTLFEWLTTLYPVWAGIDADAVHVAAKARSRTSRKPGARRAPTTITSCPPRRRRRVRRGDRRGRRGRNPVPSVPRFDGSGTSAGGLPPDHIVEDLDAILDAAGRRSSSGTIRRSIRCCGSRWRRAHRSP